MTSLVPNDPDYWTPLPFFAGVSSTAQEHGLRIVHHPLGPSEEEDSTPVAAILEMPPGYTLPRHSHNCERIEIVVRGTLTADGRELGPGSVLKAGADEFYGPHVAGPQGCLTVEVFASVRGVGNVTIDTPGGPQSLSYRDGASASEQAAGADDTIQNLPTKGQN